MKSNFLISCFLLLFAGPLFSQTTDLTGAWESGPPENHIIMIITSRHWSAVVTHTTNKLYLGTCGGTWRAEKDQFIERHEFNTMKPEWIGTELKSLLSIKDATLSFKTNDKTEVFTRIDDGTPGKLTGAWVITGRTTAQGIQKITPGARKTMKILSGTRFQWIAFNSETKEFFGTGAGTYTTDGGKYTESIDVFSRDNSRVGMRLGFDFTLEQGDWHHQGLSSKGDPIDEFWTKRELLEK